MSESKQNNMNGSEQIQQTSAEGTVVMKTEPTDMDETNPHESEQMETGELQNPVVIKTEPVDVDEANPHESELMETGEPLLTTFKVEPDEDMDEENQRRSVRQNEMMNEFSAVASVAVGKGRFYLQLADWNLESALASYYEELSGDESGDDGNPDVELQGDNNAEREYLIDLAAGVDEPTTSNPVQWQPPSNRITTFSSLMNQNTKKKQDSIPLIPKTDIISTMINAKILAEQKFTSTSAPSGSSNENSANASGTTNFSGTGYRLGMTENDTTVIPSAVPTRIKIWRNGFTINDGEFHSTELPENKNFIRSVYLGKKISTLHLKKFNATQMDNIHIDDFGRKEYEPKKKLLEGSSHLLESTAPEEISADNGVPNETAARAEVPLSPDVPTTALHIRLADGTRLVAKFNHNHTIGDIRRYILAARPSFRLRPFKLQSSFPPKTLDHDKQTLSEAGLLNTVIFQRFG